MRVASKQEPESVPTAKEVVLGFSAEALSSHSKTMKSRATRIPLGGMAITKHSWAATARKIHLVGDGNIPLCLQRHGVRAKPLVRVFASGEDLALAETLGIDQCEECMDTLSFDAWKQ